MGRNGTIQGHLVTALSNSSPVPRTSRKPLKSSDFKGFLLNKSEGEMIVSQADPTITAPQSEALDKRQSRRALALVWLAVFCVSTASIFVRWSNAPSLVLAAYRKTFITMLLIPAVFGSAERRNELKSLTRGTVLWCLLSGCFLAIHFWTYFLSVNNTTVAASQVLTGTEVLFVALAMVLMGKERYGAWSKLGIAVALAGALLVAYTPGGFSAGGTLFGNLCGIAAAAMMAGYSLIGTKVRVGVSNTVYTFLVYGTAALVLNVMVGFSPYSFTGYGWINYLMGFLMAVFNSLMGHSIFNWSLKYLSPTLVAIIKLFQPVFSTTWAFLLLSELPAVNQLAGGMVVILGIYLYVRHKDTARSEGN